MIYKRGKVYWYKFMWQGRLVRESTKQRNDKTARQMESAHRTSLAKGEVGIREKKAAPTLAEFLKRDFLPFVETQHAAKPNTLRYYKTGAASLTDSNLAAVRLDEINDQHAQQYAARLARLSPSTINCGLRTLRRAIYLAAEWRTLDRRPKIRLAKGERQRDRVLSDAEVDAYLKACDQPWRDVATIMLGTGMRPGEVFSLRWDHVLLNGQGGFIQLGFPLSRIFGADPKGRNAGWTGYLYYGDDQATARDARRFGARGARSDLFSGNVQYKWNQWVTFAYEEGYYRTRADNRAGALPLFRGIPSFTTHNIRSEFAAIFSF